MSLGGTSPYQVLYQWAGSAAPYDAAYTPTMAVDDSPPPNSTTFLQSPVGVNVGPAGNVDVSTPNGNRVIQFSGTTGNQLNNYASGGSISNPMYQAFNGSNQLFVPNTGNDSVSEFNPAATTPPSSIPGFVIQGYRLSTPKGAAFGPDGNLYVASQGGNDVLEYDGASGAFITRFVLPSTGGLASPDGVAFDTAGNLYVSSSTTNTVLEFYGPTAAPANQGKLLATISGPALNIPGALAYNGAAGTVGAGDLFIANTGNDSVALSNGGTPSTLIQGQRLSTPQGAVAATLNGVPVLLVVSRGTNSILEYDGVSGAFIKALVLSGGPTGQLNQPDSLAVDASGNVYVTSANNNLVLRYDSNGNASPSPGNTGAIYASAGMSSPAGLAFDPKSGDLFVVSSTTRSIERFAGPTRARRAPSWGSSSIIAAP